MKLALLQIVKKVGFYLGTLNFLKQVKQISNIEYLSRMMPIVNNKMRNICKNNLNYLCRKIIPAVMFMSISRTKKKC